MFRSALVLASIFLSLVLQTVTAARSVGCEASTDGDKPVDWEPKPGEVKLFRVNDRNVRVTIPETYKKNKASPVIIAYHDKDQSPEYLEFESAFGDPAVNKDAIMVYPSAENDRWVSDFSKLAKPGAKPERYTEDIEFTSFLVRDLEALVCLDTSRVYAAGMGTGGGMMHLLACDPAVSKLFAAFAAVAGAFGRSKRGQAPWGVCETERESIPIMEVHGLDDRLVGYYLTEGENGKSRQIPPHWIEDWAERNQCGEPEGDAVQSTKDEATFITKLGNGVMTETIQYGGSVIRIARKCFGDDKKAKNKPLPDEALSDKETTVLHYQVKEYGHGWPRQQLRKEKEIMFKDQQITIKSKTQFFDTSKMILSFFNGHKLPVKYASRDKEGAPGAAGATDLPSPEQLENRLKEMQAEQLKAGSRALTDQQIEEQVAQFRVELDSKKNSEENSEDMLDGDVVSEEMVLEESRDKDEL